MGFSVTILGSSSALPTSKKYPSAHLLNIDERFFLIDCGEGTQIQLRRFKAPFGRINNIFISHLHGDHIFGIFGLLSSFDLLGRKNDLNIYAPAGFSNILKFYMLHFGREDTYRIKFHSIENQFFEPILEDKKLIVYAFPLTHKIPCYGFLFKEKQKDRNVIKDMIAKYNLNLKDILELKHGHDITTKEGIPLSNRELTIPPYKPRGYAFVTDTVYMPSLSNYLNGVDLLYHETTFLSNDLKLARETCHSTTKQAAQLAIKTGAGKLIIGHFSNRYKSDSLFLKEAQELFPNTYLASEGEKFEIDRIRE